MAVLVEWLWQGMALAAAAAVVLRLAPRTNAVTRHLVWWAALVAVLVLPLARRGMAVAVGGLVREGVAPGANSLVPLPVPAAPDWVGAIAVGAWLGFVLVGFARLAGGLARLWCLHESAIPLPAAHEARLPLWRQARANGRPAALCVSDEATVPCALGLGRPVVLVPRHLAATLSDASLDQMVLHEYAHLARRDDWWRLVQVLVEAVAGFHPAVWWIGRRIDLEREAACDDYVVAHTGAARRYAECLAEVASLARLTVTGRGEPALAPGAMRQGSVLRLRVGRLLDDGRTGGLRPGRLRLAAGLSALACAVVVLGSCTPLLAFVEPAETGAGAEWSARDAPADRGALAQVPGASYQAAGRGPSAVSLEPAREQWRNVRGSPVVSVDRGAVPGPGRDTPGLPRPPPSRELESNAIGASPGAERLEVRSVASIAPPIVTPRPAYTPGAAGDRGAWSMVADAGTAVGAGTKKAGTAVGGFFVRAGRAAGRAFD